jgi:hypothetical protein
MEKFFAPLFLSAALVLAAIQPAAAVQNVSSYRAFTQAVAAARTPQQVVGLYARFANQNPILAFGASRVASLRIARLAPVAARASLAVQLANATANAYINSGQPALQGSFTQTITYLVSTVPTQQRTQAVIDSFSQAAVAVNNAAGGTPTQDQAITNVINAVAGPPAPPVS